jgi:hypothetical protein
MTDAPDKPGPPIFVPPPPPAARPMRLWLWRLLYYAMTPFGYATSTILVLYFAVQTHYADAGGFKPRGVRSRSNYRKICGSSTRGWSVSQSHGRRFESIRENQIGTLSRNRVCRKV